LCLQAQCVGRKYPAQFILPSRQGWNVLPETGCDFIFHIRIPSLTGRNADMATCIFYHHIMPAAQEGDIFLCCDRLNLSE
jgi:hypothetical protein